MKTIVGIEDYLYKYGLHDTTITSITVEKNSIVFHFPSGIYKVDENNKEKALSSSCLMKITLFDLNLNKIYEHIEIKNISKTRIYEIKFKSFLQLCKNINYQFI